MRPKDGVEKFKEKIIQSQAGQALLEYILLLVIALGLLGGIIYQFNTAFQKYANAYFVGSGSYLGCLVKNGILPDGGDNSEACQKPSFNLQVGQIKPGSGASSGGSSPGKKSPSNGEHASSTAGAGGSSGRANEHSSGLIPINSSSGKGALAAAAKSAEKPGATGSDGYSTSAQQGEGWEGNHSSSRGSSRRRAMVEADDQEWGNKKQNVTVPANNKDLVAARDPAFEKSKRIQGVNGEADTTFSFGNILKYLLIAAIVFMIIFFLGSQVVAVTRSRRK